MSYNSPSRSGGASGGPAAPAPLSLPKVRSSAGRQSGFQPGHSAGYQAAAGADATDADDSLNADALNADPFTPNVAPATPRMLRASSSNVDQSFHQTSAGSAGSATATATGATGQRLMPGVDFDTPSRHPSMPSRHASAQDPRTPPRQQHAQLHSQPPPQHAQPQYSPMYNAQSPRTPRQQSQQQQQQQQQQQHAQYQQQPQPQPSSASKSQQQQQQQPTSQAPHTQQFHRKSIGDWNFCKTIGAGSMGKVKLARHRVTGEICAVKVVPRASKIWQRQHVNDPPTNDQKELARRRKEYDKEVARDCRTVREGALGKIMYHPYICRLYEMFPMTNHYYMLFEYVSGGQMLDYIVSHGSLKERQARKFCRGIASALDYCHLNNIVHRDLKIENIMISKSGDIKIIDFGLSNLFDGEHLLKTYCGSLYFAAPELLSAHPYVGPEVDVWSFGVVLYVLVCGKVPFDDQSVSALHEKIKRGHVIYPDNLSHECINLLSRMLVVDPSRRATLHEVMCHPWMLKGYNGPPPNYLHPRTPLLPPLDPGVIATIVSLELGNSEQQVTEDLATILASDHYQQAVRNWQYHESKDPRFDPNIPDPTRGFHPLVSIYFLVSEMLQRKRTRDSEAAIDAAPQKINEEDVDPRQPIASQPQIQSQLQPQSQSQYHPHVSPQRTRQPASRIVSQPLPKARYAPPEQPIVEEQRAAKDTPVLAFPEAAYRSPRISSNVGPASSTFRRDSAGSTTGSSSAAKAGSISPPPQQQQPQAQHRDSQSQSQSQSQGMQGSQAQPEGIFGNSLFRRLSTKISGPHPTSTMGSTDATEGRIRRVGSVKVTSKEKQAMRESQGLPPLPQSAKQQVAQHQRTNSAAMSPIPGDRLQAVGQQPIGATGAATPKKYHPTARGKSLGHARKRSFNVPKSGTYTISPDAPPVPHIQPTGDDGFFDEIDMDDVTYGDGQQPKKLLTDEEIIQQYEQSPPGSMPSIEYPKTLFLKGFFSVQTTSTKPLPVIRYDIIRVLPSLGVKYTEVKGGFVCIKYPSIASDSDDSDDSHDYTNNSDAEQKVEETSTTVVDCNSTPSAKASPEPTDEEGQQASLSGSVNSKGSTANTLATNGHRRKFSLGNSFLSHKRKDSISEPPELIIPTTPAPANVRRLSEESSESINLENVDGASDMLVSSRVEQANKPRSINAATSHDEKHSPPAPLKFEIHIVKVPLVGLYGVQFKKVSGNTWQYKSLAAEILKRLNL